MKKYVYALLITLFLFNCSTDDSDNANNTPPSSFSVNTTATSTDGATIEWTDAIDPDDDNVTYAIILEGEEIASGGSTLIFSFSGLEPDTNYEGYVEARDGNGGTTRANFFFTTMGQVITLNVDATYWEFSNVPEEGGQRIVFRAGFKVPFYEDATLYQIEIINYEFNGSPVNGVIGETFTWTNNSFSVPIGQQDSSGELYGVIFNGASINTLNNNFDAVLGSYQSVIGEAVVTIMLE